MGVTGRESRAVSRAEELGRFSEIATRDPRPATQPRV